MKLKIKDNTRARIASPTFIENMVAKTATQMMIEAIKPPTHPVRQMRKIETKTLMQRTVHWDKILLRCLICVRVKLHAAGRITVLLEPEPTGHVWRLSVRCDHTYQSLYRQYITWETLTCHHDRSESQNNVSKRVDQHDQHARPEKPITRGRVVNEHLQVVKPQAEIRDEGVVLGSNFADS